MNGTVVNQSYYHAVGPGSLLSLHCTKKYYIWQSNSMLDWVDYKHVRPLSIGLSRNTGDKGTLVHHNSRNFFFFFLFRIFNLFLFSFNGERSYYIISLTTEPPITLSNKQLLRNGVLKFLCHRYCVTTQYSKGVHVCSQLSLALN